MQYLILTDLIPPYILANLRTAISLKNVNKKYVKKCDDGYRKLIKRKLLKEHFSGNGN